MTVAFLSGEEDWTTEEKNSDCASETPSATDLLPSTFGLCYTGAGCGWSTIFTGNLNEWICGFCRYW